MRYLFALWKPNGECPAWSHDYSPLQGDRLARSIRKQSPEAEVACVTDYDRHDFEEDIECHEFLYSRRDWSSMMELYRPEIVQNRAIYMGLDTVVVGDLRNIEDQVDEDGLCHIMPLDPYAKPLPCNGVVGLNRPTAQAIWFQFATEVAMNNAVEKADYFMFGRFSEMVWLRHNAKQTATWDALTPGKVQSYKVDLMPGDPGEDVSIVYFHGNPKPTELSHKKWIEEAWA